MELVKILVGKGVKFDSYCIYKCVEGPAADNDTSLPRVLATVRYLLDQGIQFSGENIWPFFKLDNDRHWKASRQRLLEFYMGTGTNLSALDPLGAAAQQNNPEAIAYLLNKGYKPLSANYYYLDDIESMLLLAEAGINANVKKSKGDAVLCLYIAQRMANNQWDEKVQKTITRLYENGADPKMIPEVLWIGIPLKIGRIFDRQLRQLYINPHFVALLNKVMAAQPDEYYKFFDKTQAKANLEEFIALDLLEPGILSMDEARLKEVLTSDELFKKIVEEQREVLKQLLEDPQIKEIVQKQK